MIAASASATPLRTPDVDELAAAYRGLIGTGSQAFERALRNRKRRIELQSIDDRIHNWVRANQWFTMQGVVFSLEGNYRSPQRGHWEQVPPRLNDPINFWDAWALELAWRRLPRLARWTIKFHFHDKLHPSRACRLMRNRVSPPIPYAVARDWEKYLTDSKAHLEREVARHAALGDALKIPPPPLDFLDWVRRNRVVVDVLAD